MYYYLIEVAADSIVRPTRRPRPTPALRVSEFITQMLPLSLHSLSLLPAPLAGSRSLFLSLSHHLQFELLLRHWEFVLFVCSCF